MGGFWEKKPHVGHSGNHWCLGSIQLLLVFQRVWGYLPWPMNWVDEVQHLSQPHLCCHQLLFDLHLQNGIHCLIVCFKSESDDVSSLVEVFILDCKKHLYLFYNCICMEKWMTGEKIFSETWEIPGNVGFSYWEGKYSHILFVLINIFWLYFMKYIFLWIPSF